MNKINKQLFQIFVDMPEDMKAKMLNPPPPPQNDDARGLSVPLVSLGSLALIVTLLFCIGVAWRKYSNK